MLEMLGALTFPWCAGAEYPLVRRKRRPNFGSNAMALSPGLAPGLRNSYHPPDQLGKMPEGKPTTKPADEDAAHFLIRMVHKYPHRGHDL